MATVYETPSASTSPLDESEAVPRMYSCTMRFSRHKSQCTLGKTTSANLERAERPDRENTAARRSRFWPSMQRLSSCFRQFCHMTEKGWSPWLGSTRSIILSKYGRKATSARMMSPTPGSSTFSTTTSSSSGPIRRALRLALLLPRSLALCTWATEAAASGSASMYSKTSLMGRPRHLVIVSSICASGTHSAFSQQGASASVTSRGSKLFSIDSAWPTFTWNPPFCSITSRTFAAAVAM
mmetsp:Transcript_119471/g.338777  ORF Transcript_119471/g.338777 Transcript_119471/m.338777 type:complete len:239 (-) Transcript_119471:680-1396(-)